VAGVAVWTLVGGVPGLTFGVLAAAVLDVVFRRLEPRSRVLDRAEASADLPFAVDLLGAALAGGATLDGGIRCVAAAVGGPLGRRLAQVAAALALDADPRDVWRPVADLPTAQPVVRAALRSGRSGAALAGALSRAAKDARRSAAAADDVAARRAGVLAVLPVGLCFLPAFVLLGVVPVAASVLAGVLAR
jgi:pilus assembly protein TadC